MFAKPVVPFSTLLHWKEDSQLTSTSSQISSEVESSPSPLNIIFPDSHVSCLMSQKRQLEEADWLDNLHEPIPNASSSADITSKRVETAATFTLTARSLIYPN